MKKKLFSVLVALATIFSASAQSLEQPNTDWVELTRKDGVIFWIKRQECSIVETQKPLQYAFMRIENTNAENKQLSFNFGIQYTDVCSGCDDFSENHVDLSISGNRTIEGDCSFENHLLTRLIYNPNHQHGRTFVKEVITNLTVK
jgi:hypothetical protein